jgi:transposase
MPPDIDIAALLERLSVLEATVVTLHATVARLEAENAELRETVAKQDALIRKYQAMLFGKKSEKGPPPTPPASPSTADSVTAPAPETAAATPAPASRPRGQRRGASGHGRRLYEELPPRVVLHDLPTDARQCPTCGEAYVPGGTEDATTIEWEVLIRRVVHQRQKYHRACACATPTLLTAPPPPKLIPKGLLEVSAIANLVVNKFLHGQPINRQLQELTLLCGVRLAPGTLVGIQDTVGALVRPLYAATLRHLREANHWHADETRWMQYGDETKTRWWLWVFAAADAVAFVLDPTRSRAVPRRVFGLDDEAEDAHRAAGIISCDRWKSYQGLAGLQTAFCWAHVRRDFLGVAKGYPCLLGAWAQTWVEQIGTLYALTDTRRLTEPGTEAFRQADARLRDHVAALALSRDADLGDAGVLPAARAVLDSLTRHWDGLTLFLDHPGVPLDNNPAERLLRTMVVGRKNFYGSGSLSSGALAESAYSVLLTATKHGLNPLTYLRAYLDACAAHGGKPPRDIKRFLPWTASADDLAAWKLHPTAA